MARRKKKKEKNNPSMIIFGETYPHRKALNRLGCRYDRKKRLWRAPSRSAFEKARALVQGEVTKVDLSKVDRPPESKSDGHRKRALAKKQALLDEAKKKAEDAGKTWYEPGTVNLSRRQGDFELERFEGD